LEKTFLEAQNSLHCNQLPDNFGARDYFGALKARNFHMNETMGTSLVVLFIAFWREDKKLGF